MATIMVRVSEGQKELWVGAAHDERVSLSEWIRRRCDGGLGSGEVPAVSPPVARSGSPEPSPLDVVSPDAAQGVRVGKASFRPDPKKKP